MNPSKESQICAPGTEAQGTVMPGSRSRIMRILGLSSLLLMAAEGCATLSAKSDSVLDTIQRQNDIAQKMGSSICMNENKTCVINCGINEMETFLTSDLVGINRTKLSGAEMEDFKNEPLVTDKDGNVTMYVGCVKSVVQKESIPSIPSDNPPVPPRLPKQPGKSVSAKSPAAEPDTSPKGLDSSAKLRVNTDPVHYKVSKSRTDGEKDLFELCETADKEEAWLFIKNANGEAVWHEIGYDEKAGSARADYSYLKNIPKDTQEITLYHHHPVTRDKAHDLSQTPSTSDLIAYISVLNTIAAFNPEIINKIDFRIANSTGIYVIRFNPKIITNKKLLEKVADKAVAMEKERMMFPNFNYGQSNRGNFPKENIRFAIKFSNGVMQITFIPNNNPNVKPFQKLKVIDLGGIARDEEGTVYDIKYLPERKTIYLKSYGNPLLYNENGDRIGFENIEGRLSFREPSNGWPKDLKSHIDLTDISKELLAKKKNDLPK